MTDPRNAPGPGDDQPPDEYDPVEDMHDRQHDLLVAIAAIDDDLKLNAVYAQSYGRAWTHDRRPQLLARRLELSAQLRALEYELLHRKGLS